MGPELHRDLPVLVRLSTRASSACPTHQTLNTSPYFVRRTGRSTWAAGEHTPSPARVIGMDRSRPDSPSHLCRSDDHCSTSVPQTQAITGPSSAPGWVAWSTLAWPCCPFQCSTCSRRAGAWHTDRSGRSPSRASTRVAGQRLKADRQPSDRVIFVGSCARPLPVHRMDAQFPTNGVRMDVISRLPNVRWVPQVSIKTTSSLPKAKRLFPVWLDAGHARGKLGCILLYDQPGALRHRLLQRAGDSADRVVHRERVNQQMHMLGHDDIRPNVEAVFGARLFDRVDQPAPRAVPAQKRLLIETRERERVRVAGVAVSPARLVFAGVDLCWLRRHGHPLSGASKTLLMPTQASARG